MVERLLGLAHLTDLLWEAAHMHTLQPQRHMLHGPPLRRLRFERVSPAVLLRMSASLAAPAAVVAWRALEVSERTQLADVQSDAALFAAPTSGRSGAAGCAWPWRGGGGDDEGPVLSFAPRAAGGAAFAHGAAEGDTPAALLRALRPLLAGLEGLCVMGLAWDVELVKVLGEVLPRTCTRLELVSGKLSSAACGQLPASLPWLERLGIHVLSLVAHALTMLLGRAVGQAEAQGLQRPTLRRLQVSGMGTVGDHHVHWIVWDDARQALQALVGTDVVLDIDVE